MVYDSHHWRKVGLMIKAVLLAPEFDNERHPFMRAAFEELEARLLPFGGWSRQSGVEGAWRSGGRVYRDVSYQYAVSLTTWDQLPAWLAVVHWAREYFRQEAIYIEVAGVPDIIAGADG